MDTKISEIAQRIKTLREILEISVEDMATYLKTTPDEYAGYENGSQDFSVTFLQKCATKFGVDVVELLTGENPKLSFYTVTRKEHGIGMSRREGFSYQHMAHNLKGKLAEPFLVVAPFSNEAQDKDISLSTHDGQEIDFVLKGSLKMKLESHIVTLNEGDAIMYDSSHGHGMIATNGKDCEFLAIVIKN
ncbi:MAG: XRE family transcriptional regulator [Oscillospiraceae bacterium]